MSIFSLKTNPDELKSSNSGISDFKYSEYTPSRDVTGTNFLTEDLLSRSS